MRNAVFTSAFLSGLKKCLLCFFRSFFVYDNKWVRLPKKSFRGLVSKYFPCYGFYLKTTLIVDLPQFKSALITALQLSDRAILRLEGTFRKSTLIDNELVYIKSATVGLLSVRYKHSQVCQTAHSHYNEIV